MKKNVRIIINILMTIFFIILMGYHITENKIHEYLGVITLLLMIIHNILNINWYKSLLKGKYNFQRTMYVITDLALLVATIGIAVSSIMISAGIVDKIRKEEGNLKYDYFFPMDNNETLLLIDNWKDQESLDIHHQSEMMKEIAELREKYDLHMKVEKYIRQEDNLNDKKYIKE